MDVAPRQDAAVTDGGTAAADTPEAPEESEAAEEVETEEDANEAEEAWCPEGIETLPGPACAVVPEQVQSEPAPTLVIFLHGITNVGSGWQIGLITGMSRYAKHQRFALLAPRAPLQPHVEGKPDIYAWRTRTLSEAAEDAMLQGWMAAKATLEGRTGRPFERVFVMGFSSGAYYVSSLALRGRLDVDGYAAFAGGSAPYSRTMIKHVKNRVPIFVGYGTRDRTARTDARELVAALRRARWKHHSMAVRAGHTITTKQFTSALAYLRAQSSPGASGSPPSVRGVEKRRGSKHRVKPRQW